MPNSLRGLSSIFNTRTPFSGTTAPVDVSSGMNDPFQTHGYDQAMRMRQLLYALTGRSQGFAETPLTIDELRFGIDRFDIDADRAARSRTRLPGSLPNSSTGLPPAQGAARPGGIPIDGLLPVETGDARQTVTNGTVEAFNSTQFRGLGGEQEPNLFRNNESPDSRNDPQSNEPQPGLRDFLRDLVRGR